MYFRTVDSYAPISRNEYPCLNVLNIHEFHFNSIQIIQFCLMKNLLFSVDSPNFVVKHCLFPNTRLIDWPGPRSASPWVTRRRVSSKNTSAHWKKKVTRTHAPVAGASGRASPAGCAVRPSAVPDTFIIYLGVPVNSRPFLYGAGGTRFRGRRGSRSRGRRGSSCKMRKSALVAMCRLFHNSVYNHWVTLSLCESILLSIDLTP
jgi:hypothetical protein